MRFKNKYYVLNYFLYIDVYKKTQLFYLTMTSNTYKALIITAFLSIIVLLLGFTIHIKKKAELMAETYYEIDSEEFIEEEKETLEEILKSLDNITTNKAYSKTKKQENIEDAEFEKKLEAIKNRNNATQTEETQAKNPSEKILNPNENAVFNDIKDIINKRDNTKREDPNNTNKNSSIFYSLVDRKHTFLPIPIYLCEFGGKVVINISVNSNGDVTETYVNSSSVSNNGCLIDSALEYAKAAKFNSNAAKPSQLGTITFYFKGKQ